MSVYYRVDFHIGSNEDLRQDFAMSDGAAAPIDLTGANLKMDVESLSGDRVIEASLGNGRISITDATQGRFEIAIPASAISSLAEGSYRHDLLLVRGSATKRIWEGFITVDRGVTA